MTKVPEIPESVRKKVKPTDTLIICNGGKKLHPQDEKALNEWIDMVKARHQRRKARNKS